MKKIKLSLLKSMLHKSELFDNYTNGFLKDIEEKLNTKIELTDLEDYDCDLKLIFIASGGSEGLFLENFDKLKPPYYLLTTGANNSLAASLEILTYLNNNNYDGEVIHGDIEYITNRINSLLKKDSTKPKYKLGVIGKPSDWLISSVPDYEKIKNVFNIELEDINLYEVVNKYNLLNGKNLLIDNKGFDSNEVINANKFYEALSDTASRHSLNGLTIRCFDLLPVIKMTGCMALSKLNDEGITSACEGDIMAMITMHLVKEWFDLPTFQANPSRIDPSNKKIVFAHCTCPLKMVKEYKYDTHFESGIGLGIKGELKEEDVTIFRLSSDLKKYFVENGKIIRNLSEPNLCRTQIEVEMENSESLLMNPCGNHHIIFYGHHKDEVLERLKEYYK